MDKNTLFLLLAAGGAYYVWAQIEKKKREKELMLGGKEEPTATPQLMDEIIARTEAPEPGLALAARLDDSDGLWMDDIVDPWAGATLQ